MSDAPTSYADIEKRARRGRPKGALSASTRALVQSVQLRMDLHACELTDALAAVFEDKRESLPVRLAAGRCLFGAYAGKVLRPEGPGGGA
jgi:hypothetical protein